MLYSIIISSHVFRTRKTCPCRHRRLAISTEEAKDIQGCRYVQMTATHNANRSTGIELGSVRIAANTAATGAGELRTTAAAPSFPVIGGLAAYPERSRPQAQPATAIPDFAPPSFRFNPWAQQVPLMPVTFPGFAPQQPPIASSSTVSPDMFNMLRMQQMGALYPGVQFLGPTAPRPGQGNEGGH